MDPTLKMSLVCIAILTCHFISTSTAIKIKITTKRYKGVVPTSIDVTCTLDPEKSDYYRAKRIMAIKVSRRDERPLAVLQQNSKIFYDRLLAPNIEAKGHIDQDPTKSNLTVTLNKAMKEDSGVYNCSLLYFDRWGYIQREEASTNVSIEDNNVHDVTRYFVGELKMLKNQLAELSNKTTLQVEKDDNDQVVDTHLLQRLADLETTLKTQHGHQQKEIDSLKKQLGDKTDYLNKQLGDQQKEIDSLKTSLGDKQKEIDNLKTEHRDPQKEIDGLKRELGDETDILNKQLGDHQNEIDSLKTSLGDKQKEIDSLKTEHRDQQKEIDGLKKELGDETDNLNKQLGDHQKVIGSLETQHGDQQKEIESLKTSLGDKQKEIDSLKQQRVTYEAQYKLLDNKVTQHVTKESFRSAFLAGGKSGDKYEKRKIVKYPTVKLNIGGHYNPGTGVYTAPVDGLYVFHVLGTNYGANVDVYISIRVNGVAASRRNAYDKDGWVSSSMSVIANLKTGDRVDCYVYHVTGVSVGIDGFPLTAFSGYLIKTM